VKCIAPLFLSISYFYLSEAENYIYLYFFVDMVAGGSIDWVYDELCVKHSYAVELRDQGTYGFILPPEQIVPTAEEYYAGLKSLATHLQTLDSYTSSSCSCRSNLEEKNNCSIPT